MGPRAGQIALGADLARLRPLALDALIPEAGFWAHRQLLNDAVNLPEGWTQLASMGQMDNLRMAAGDTSIEHRGEIFQDSDLYKWLEAACWQLTLPHAEQLEEQVASLIELIERAQAPDGYLDTAFQSARPRPRWRDLAWDHELYCAGHLFQAAVAHRRVTGDDRLLAVAKRFADHICDTFGPHGRPGLCGHPGIEMAMVELYRETGAERYLEQARLFIDRRGHGLLGPGLGGPAYFQDHVPFRASTRMEGHAVRQLYLTAGAVDVYLETGEDELLDACLRQWEDLELRKQYVTGGSGSQQYGESYGEPFELSNEGSYSETCAAIATVMLAWRLQLATGLARFGDAIERTLYNGFLSGLSLRGGEYFYVNTLLSTGREPARGHRRVQRSRWYDCACCPPNVMRLLASVHQYWATSDDSGVQLQQYAPARIKAATAAGSVALHTATEFPSSGRLTVTVDESPATPWVLALRVPQWAPAPRIAIGGEPVRARVSDGYAHIERRWRAGDRLESDIELVPHMVQANPRVDADRGSAAIVMGPLVYCLEQVDQEPDVDILDVEVERQGAMTVRPGP
jgi:hypothetical protein